MTEEHRRVQHPGGGRIMVKKAEHELANINSIMAKWITTGVVPVSGQEPSYGDFTNVEDYHSAMNQIKAADEDFLALPPHIRKHVRNDVGEFLDMVFDPERRGELEELGLAPTQAPEAAPPAAEAPEPAEEPSPA